MRKDQSGFQILKFLQCHDVALSEWNGDCSDEASLNDFTGRSIAVASRTGVHVTEATPTQSLLTC